MTDHIASSRINKLDEKKETLTYKSALGREFEAKQPIYSCLEAKTSSPWTHYFIHQSIEQPSMTRRESGKKRNQSWEPFRSEDDE